MMDNEYFGIVRWHRADIIEALKERGIKPTPENIEEVFVACDEDHHFTDEMIRAGWEALDSKIYDLLLKGKLQFGFDALFDSISNAIDHLEEGS